MAATVRWARNLARGFYRVFYRTRGNGGSPDGTMAQGRGEEAQVNATIRHAMVRVAHNPKVAGSNPAPATN